MFRLIVWLFLALPALAAEQPFVASPNFSQAGPAAATGALVWVHGTYAADAPGPPDEPDIVGRLARRGLDVWRFNRARGADPLVGSGEILAQGLKALRQSGYRWIAVAGHSRGAWIALTAIGQPNLADAIVAISPAAFGSRPERRSEAMAAWESLWRSAQTAKTRVALVQLADDPYDHDPASRLATARARLDRAGLPLLPIFQPPVPRGHIGVYEPSFDEQIGADIESFVLHGR